MGNKKYCTTLNWMDSRMYFFIEVKNYCAFRISLKSELLSKSASQNVRLRPKHGGGELMIEERERDDDERDMRARARG